MKLSWIRWLPLVVFFSLSGCNRFAKGDDPTGLSGAFIPTCDIAGLPKSVATHFLPEGGSLDLSSDVVELGEGPGHSTTIWQLGDLVVVFRFDIAETARYWAARRTRTLDMVIDGVNVEFYGYKDYHGHTSYAVVPVERPELPVARFINRSGSFDPSCALHIARTIKWSQAD